jgi:hypothetical protein
MTDFKLSASLAGHEDDVRYHSRHSTDLIYIEDSELTSGDNRSEQ